MRWSQMHIPTLRDDPADADADSHRLLLRAGYIRQLMAGHYSLLPLAVRVRTKVIAVIREEMDRIGAQEFLLPAMHPAELWQRSGRWDVMGEEMFRLRDRKRAEIALGMTHEEVFTTLAVELKSYRDLPQIWYQFQTKFRDEPRPKAGLMRTREFTMKDSYSFDLRVDGLESSFNAHRDAYVRIFARLGIPAVAVQASSGSMGGSTSMEFMCRSDAGEDLVASCSHCGYAANVERATSQVAAVTDGPGRAAPERFATPGVRTIDDLASRYGVGADRQIKTLVYVVDDQITLVLLRGDHVLMDQKLADALGATTIRPAHLEEIRATLGASPGSLGAAGVSDLTVVADEALRKRRDMTTGANVDEVHLRGVDVDRDVAVDHWADLREVRAGEPCPTCGHGLRVEKAIEVGHIFQLGVRYSEALGATVLDAEGNRTAIVMGSYGIGVERAMAAVIETHHDERGIVWPVAVAPYEVAVVVAQPKDDATMAAGIAVYEQLRTAGVDVIVDDRQERAGVKFTDVELIGIPFRVTVGTRNLLDGAAELTDRRTGQTRVVALADLTHEVQAAIAASRR